MVLEQHTSIIHCVTLYITEHNVILVDSANTMVLNYNVFLNMYGLRQYIVRKQYNLFYCMEYIPI